MTLEKNVEDKKLNQEVEECTAFGVFTSLKGRIKKTRLSRINASKRLREKHEFYEKITHFYSILILVLSIWYISDSTVSVQSLMITKMLLIFSLSLTYFTMYINIKNYKERASEFETNYRNLDIVLNKMDRIELEKDKIDVTILKDLHREYEKLLLEKENHKDIDFMVSTDKRKKIFEKEISSHNRSKKFENFLVSIYPLILVIILLGTQFLFNYICNDEVEAISNAEISVDKIIDIE